ncbi:hypothetical protein FHS86_000246 [Roseimarinus sediminis]
MLNFSTCFIVNSDFDQLVTLKIEKKYSIEQYIHEYLL